MLPSAAIRTSRATIRGRCAEELQDFSVAITGGGVRQLRLYANRFRDCDPNKVRARMPTQSSEMVPGSGTDWMPPPLKPALPKSVRPVPRSAPPAPQVSEMVLPANVTAPVSARALPHTIVALVFRVMLSRARMFPAKVVLVPRVAELPTSQNTPVLAPPLITLTVEPLAVVRVLPISKTKSASGLLCASRVSVPVN